MTDIVGRLRECARQSDPPTSELYDFAADEIETLTKERDEMSNLALRDGKEVERLRAEVAEWQEKSNGRQEIIREMTERNEHFRAALRIIAGEEQCRDNLLGNSDIARITLHGK